MSQAQEHKFSITHESMDGDGTETKTFEDQNNFSTTLDILKEKELAYEIDTPDWYGDDDDEDEATTDGGTVEAEIVDHTEEVTETESVKEPDVVDEPVNPEELSKDPIGFLKSVNSDFVNRIKGKDAISKQGFRFIQREFEITTQSEVVEWSEDPLGCVVWAKAELDDGYAAEAHGEGYKFESDVSDNEFVRYADTRAKNRAISDLTSAGALAVSELGGSDE
jgi:hypothetical protein